MREVTGVGRRAARAEVVQYQGGGSGSGGASKHNLDVKLLMLGAGESGKSTFFKQMKILYKQGYTAEELASCREVIYTHVLTSAFMLIGTRELFGIPFQRAENAERASRVVSLADEHMLVDHSKGFTFTKELTEDIEALWHDRAIQQVYARRSEFQLKDSAAYYFHHIQRIGSPDYIPTVEDLLRSRVKTLGIVDAEFSLGSFNITLYDVGGQRPERRKWMQCFQGVDSLLFFVALNEYDLTCYEDNKTNRMKESLMLFDETINNKWFYETPVILLLNKEDLFREKIRQVDLSILFPEYKGGADFDKAVDFIAGKFRSFNKNPDRRVVVEITCATSTEEISKFMKTLEATLRHTQMLEVGKV